MNDPITLGIGAVAVVGWLVAASAGFFLWLEQRNGRLLRESSRFWERQAGIYGGKLTEQAAKRSRQASYAARVGAEKRRALKEETTARLRSGK